MANKQMENNIPKEGAVAEITPEQKAKAGIAEPEKKEEKKKETKKVQQKVKKTEVVVNAQSVQGSVKTASAICRMIRYKPLEKAIEELELVAKQKKVVKMKGEIPHKKGVGIMAGRYPHKLAKEFLVLVKSLKSNADSHDVENPIIVEAIPNKAYLPFGRMGKVRRKRFHLRLKAMEKKLWYAQNKKTGVKK
ncbi:50S ribosomal protein L22 [uncultured archaeon]|nr:50S ribosomal protein L22 [uncultured archaeon]